MIETLFSVVIVVQRFLFIPPFQIVSIRYALANNGIVVIVNLYDFWYILSSTQIWIYYDDVDDATKIIDFSKDI